MASADLIKEFQTAADVRKVGFAEFTTDLINDTADAIVGSTIKQIKAFSDLVKELAKGLDQWKAENSGPQAVASYLRTTFPNADGTDTAIKADAAYDKALYDRIVAELGPIAGLTEPEGEATETFSEENVAAIQNAAATRLQKHAEDSYRTLENLVRIGFARVVFHQGHILTRLKFNVSANTTSNSSHSSTSTTTSSIGGSLGLRIPGFVNLGFGARRSHITVESASSQSFEALSMRADIFGEVQVNFTTESFDLEKMKIEAARPSA